MPENPPAKLRIYCICGQKMRVSSNMLGRPGKCVACRQKMRIPRLDELPGDGSGYYEFYLKDHPEFLRKPAAARSVERAIREEEEEERGEEQEDLALGDPSEATEYIPLDVLEPLRILCSFEYAIERRLEALRQAGRHTDVLDKPTLLSYRALVRNARSALDEQLRQRLHETVEQLSGVSEQIARAVLGFRIGEMDFATFQSTALALRERRERLERRRVNLRGWLAVNDPYLAGGYIEVQLEQISSDGGEVTFPLEPKPAGTLMDHFIERLREALKTREHAERKLSERKRMEHEGGLSGTALEDCRADAIAERERAWAAVSFYRARLEQLVQDCEGDIKAARAHLEAARGRLDTGEIDLLKFQEIEMTLLRAQADYAKARDLARRALAADRGAAVPRATGTFLRRIGRADKTAIGIDSWIAWFASTLIILNTLTPMSRAQIGSNMAVAQGMVIGFFVMAVLLAAFACVPRRDLRGALVTGHWLIAALVGAYHIQRTWHSMSAIGVEMRSDPAWFSGSGIILFLAWIAVIGIAALIALAPYPRLRYLPVATGVAIVALIAGVFTDFSGALLPRPTLDVPEIVISESDPSQYDVSIAVENQGVIRRRMWLGGRRHQVPYPALLVLERRIGSDSWEDAGLPVRMRRDQQPVWSDVRHWQAFPLLPLGAGSRITLQYRLQPGVYRAQLILEPWNQERVRREFSLSPPPLPDASLPADSAGLEETSLRHDPLVESFQGADELPADPAILAPPPMGVRVELRGLINAADFTPRFSVIVYAPNGTVTQKRVSLGDEIYSPWHATEYNPALKTLTVSDGSRMLALQPGDTLYLEIGP